MNKKIIKFCGYFLLFIGALSMLFPFFWMLMTSFMVSEQIFAAKISFIPHPFSAKNYTDVFGQIPLSKYFINSLFVALATTLGQVIISATAAYGFARMKFPCRDILFFIVLATMMIPLKSILFHFFFIMRELSWIDTYQALIVPGLFGGFGVFLLRQCSKTCHPSWKNRQNLMDAAIL
jgi:multiple sugar transport system permease protein